MTLSGTAAQITAALASANYTGNFNYYGPDSLLVKTTDTINSATTGPQTVGITLADTTTVSDALPASLSGNENTAISLSGSNAISVSDTPNTGDVLHTTLTVSHGTITVGTLDGMTVVGGVNGTSSVTLSGTAAQINAALAERKLHRQLQLLRPRQPVGEDDRHDQQRHNRTADGGHHAGRYDDGVGCAACLAERQREHGDLAERVQRDLGVGYAEHRRRAAHDADGVARHHHGGHAGRHDRRRRRQRQQLGDAERDGGAITAALASANYTGNPNYYGPDSLLVTTTDTVNSATTGPQTVGITLADTTTVSDALPASLSGNENTAIPLSGSNAISVSDTPNTGDVLHTTLTVSQGTITVGTLDGMTVVGGATAAAR